ncbi:hypothetical protein LN042_21080 [Kitasatospora sp. RB6PN24]|uniref:hypothetical protein n=1 Tax=Kitasatospora humi TaxID=2893891 RepID=UPI001E4BBD8F|nr:hypothetical protein [Kitasatospora humi]MCC9309540.1 hypothetical protein [Kitasatospora humi]
MTRKAPPAAARGARPAGARGRSVRGLHEELEHATRAELYGEAEDTHVDGRSRMTGHELVEVLERELVSH